MLAKDLAELAQRRQTYWLRVWFALLLYAVTALVFAPGYVRSGTSPLAVLGSGGRLLSSLYELEWLGLCLFVPAIVSGAFAAEKERNTLQLLFLTRLGPWTILFEKLFSRLVPVAALLLVSFPILLIAFSLGGVTQRDVYFVTLELLGTAIEVGCISLFCSAFCATTASAFVMSYLILVGLYVGPYLGVAVYLGIASWKYHFRLGAVYANADTDAMMTTLNMISSTNGLRFDWILSHFGNSPLTVLPFHRSYLPPMVMTSIGLLFVVMARVVVLRRMSPQPTHRLRRLFGHLDRVFDRLGGGIELGRRKGDLPDKRPVLWREARRGNLGRLNYLIRVMLLIEVPILFPTALYAMVVKDSIVPTFLLWSIAFLVVFVRSAGLIGAERARQTLDVLMTTPLSLTVLVGEKWRGLLRVMAVVSVPVLVGAIINGYLQMGLSRPREAFYALQGLDSRSMFSYLLVVAVNLVILLPLAAQLSFLFGLLAKTQTRATMAALGVFFTWSMLPLIVRAFWTNSCSPWTLYFTPMGAVAANEAPELGLVRFGEDDWQLAHESGAFYLLPHWLTYAAIVGLLACVNFWVARRVLVRPSLWRIEASTVPGATAKAGEAAKT
jgi:ABC-type transport system involved in multi-copper enzyme maturation permease subunit